MAIPNGCWPSPSPSPPVPNNAHGKSQQIHVLRPPWRLPTVIQAASLTFSHLAPGQSTCSDEDRSR
jgi:hypothetical protein